MNSVEVRRTPQGWLAHFTGTPKDGLVFRFNGTLTAVGEFGIAHDNTELLYEQAVSILTKRGASPSYPVTPESTNLKKLIEQSKDTPLNPENSPLPRLTPVMLVGRQPFHEDQARPTRAFVGNASSFETSTKGTAEIGFTGFMYKIRFAWTSPSQQFPIDVSEEPYSNRRILTLNPNRKTHIKTNLWTPQPYRLSRYRFIEIVEAIRRFQAS